MASTSFRITDLLCEYRVNPLAIDVAAPRLTWRMETPRPGARQVAYRIIAAGSPERLDSGDADLWDSGRVDSDRSAHVPYGGKPLRSRQRVYWQVTVWDETGAAAVSNPAWFEMGLLNRRDWKAKWVAALVGGPRTTIPAPFLRKAFRLDAPVQAARFYVTSLGLHDCSLNGEPVGDTVLAPGWTDFDTRVRYEVFDVTALLRPGENVLGAVLGDGWAVGHIMWGRGRTMLTGPDCWRSSRRRWPTAASSPSPPTAHGNTASAPCSKTIS